MPLTADTVPDPSTPRPSAGADLRSVASSTALVAVMALLSRVTGFVRDATIAHLFGQGWVVDAYRYGFKLPDLLWMLILGGVMYAAYVPVITSLLTKGRDEEAWETFSIIATLLFCVFSVVIPLLWLFARPLLQHVLAPGLDPRTLELSVKLTRILLPAQYFFFLGGLMMGMQQARKRFLIPTIGPVIYNLCIIGGGVVLYRKLGIMAFAVGALSGAFIGNFLLQVLAVRGMGVRFRPSLNLRQESVVKCGKLALPVICGISLPQVDSTINGIVIASISGGMAILENTNRLMQLPLGIVGQALGIAILPTLSQQAADGDTERFKDMVNFGVRMAFFLTIPLAVTMIVLAPSVIATIYQSGQFRWEDTLRAVPSLRLYAIGIGAYAAQAVVARAFYARHDTWTPVLCGTGVTVLIFVPLNYLLFVLLRDPDPTKGYLATRGPALATAIGATCNFTLLFSLLHRRLGGVGLRRIGLSLLRILAGCLTLAALAWPVPWLLHHNHDPHRMGAALEVLTGGGLGLGAYFLVTYALGSEEARQAWDMLGGKFRRR